MLEEDDPGAERRADAGGLSLEQGGPGRVRLHEGHGALEDRQRVEPDPLELLVARRLLAGRLAGRRLMAHQVAETHPAQRATRTTRPSATRYQMKGRSELDATNLSSQAIDA